MSLDANHPEDVSELDCQHWFLLKEADVDCPVFLQTNDEGTRTDA